VSGGRLNTNKNGGGEKRYIKLQQFVRKRKGKPLHQRSLEHSERLAKENTGKGPDPPGVRFVGEGTHVNRLEVGWKDEKKCKGSTVTRR